MASQCAEEKRWVFSFYLKKEESEEECLTERLRVRLESLKV